MADKTGISWTDATWNPVRGCSRVSEGCRNCYAERVAARFSDEGMPYHGLAKRTLLTKYVNGAGKNVHAARWTGVVRLIPEHLADPIRWKRPRRIFVNSMSDLFHESLTNEEIAAVFGVMAAAPQHTFQVLTKRATRMREWFEWVSRRGVVDGWGDRDYRIALREDLDAAAGRVFSDDDCKRFLRARDVKADTWPLPNVWLGVSVENQDAADERIPELLDTPAAVRFLSCEPLLSEVDLFAFLDGALRNQCLPKLGATRAVPGIDWVIVGCESGPAARACRVEWIRSLRDQCAEAGVALFLKQATPSNGMWMPSDESGTQRMVVTDGAGSKHKAGRVIELPYLDGVQHAAFPETR